MRNGNVVSRDMINVFGDLSDIDFYLYVIDSNNYSQSMIEDIIQEKFDDWMSDDDVTQPIADYIVSRLEIENGIILKAYV